MRRRGERQRGGAAVEQAQAAADHYAGTAELESSNRPWRSSQVTRVGLPLLLMFSPALQPGDLLSHVAADQGRVLPLGLLQGGDDLAAAIGSLVFPANEAN